MAFSILRGILNAGPFLIGLLIADIIISLTVPLSSLFPLPIYNFNSAIAQFTWSWIQHIFYTHTPRITYSGDWKLITELENALVVCNHVSWADFYLIQALAIEKKMLGRCRYFAKASLKWVPLLGWGFVALGMPLVSRNWTSDEREFGRLFGRMKRNRWPMCRGTFLFYRLWMGLWRKG